MGTLANSEDLIEMLHFIRVCTFTFAMKIKTTFRDRNTRVHHNLVNLYMVESFQV